MFVNVASKLLAYNNTVEGNSSIKMPEVSHFVKLLNDVLVDEFDTRKLSNTASVR